MIRAGETNNFIQMGLGTDNEALWRALNTARNNFITYRICCCSVFDEYWINTVKGRDQFDPAKPRNSASKECTFQIFTGN